MPPAGRSSSTSATAGARSPTRSPSRPARLSYAHGSAFTTEALERYAAELGPHLPIDDPAIYPVCGGSEAIETALKLARATQLARGERGPLDRVRPLGQLPRQHARRARPVRPPPAPPPVRGLARPVPARERGVPVPRRGLGLAGAGTTQELVDELDRAISSAEPGTVCAFVGEPIVGATLAAVEPPEGYWPAIADVCRHHGVLLIADEVMTGFGRTGTWFGMDHYGVRPDLLVAAKGATSGYWPFGFVAASGEVCDAVTRGRRVRPRVHLLAPAGGGDRRPRGAADPRGGVAGRGVGDEGGAAARRCSASGWASTRPSATSAGAA